MRITLRTIPFAAALVALPLFGAGAQSPELANSPVRAGAAPTATRTPEETMAWFANEFPRLAWATTTDHTENGVAIRTYHRVRGVKLEGCTLTFASSVDTDSANVRGYTFSAYTIPLKDVNVAGVKITRADAGPPQLSVVEVRVQQHVDRHPDATTDSEEDERGAHELHPLHERPRTAAR